MAVKAWADGDYVSAADLDAITSTMNLSFANAAARDAFLVGDLAPTQGCVVNMQDDGITYHRILVGGTPYWAPAPNTFICGMVQTSATTVGASGPITQVGNMTTVAGRNLNNWWASDKFTPQVPGYYELECNVAFSGSATDSYRTAGMGFNSTTAFTAAGAAAFIPLVQSVVTVGKTFVAYFNGSTDYATILAQNGSTTAHTTLSLAQANVHGACTSIFIKYLGP